MRVSSRNEALVLRNGFLAIVAKDSKHPIGGEKIWLFSQTDRGPVTAPQPVRWLPYHPRPHWIQHDVACQFQELGFLLDQYPFETSLEEVANPCV